MIRVILFLFLVSTASAGMNAASKKWLGANKDKEGVTVLKSGLQYKVLKKGGGAFHPTEDSPCEVTYRGTLTDGTQFDAGTTTFAPNQVIRGWTEAMQLMVEGDKWELYIPSDLAYGDSGSPPKIPAGAALVFQMEIHKIKGGKKPAITCDPKTEKGCDDREKAFITKAKGMDAAKVSAQLKRLENMKDGQMTGDLLKWVNQRINILSQVDKTKTEL
eukprot:NODE_2077_length_772_cov_158.165975_g1666_i0.p1 GENE.NODE_2077_length_772_cov_158.165975_g1666_i0~~NODE_2077_length_772_cov_158.165975_g1666_i0.p1  ORF type:complete len:234 (-),score=83.06 NODE_2077_length_772_cov_158.165975_g1666_i0:69-719(-)